MKPIYYSKPCSNEEPEGWQLIAFVGQISTLELDDEVEPPWEVERIPFGFQAPVRQDGALPDDLPALTSADWALWLESPCK